MVASGIAPLDEEGFEFEQGLNLLIGPPGSGKTAVALAAARQAGKVLVVNDGLDAESKLKVYFNGKPPESLTLSTNPADVTRRNFSAYDMVIVDLTSFRSDGSPARRSELFRQTGHYAINHHCIVIFCIQTNKTPLTEDVAPYETLSHAARFAAFTILTLRPKDDLLEIEVTKSRDFKYFRCVIPFSDLIPNFKPIDAPLLKEENPVDFWDALEGDD